MEFFNKICNYFKTTTSLSDTPNKNIESDPLFQNLVDSVKNGKVPRGYITQTQAKKYLTNMYKVKNNYKNRHDIWNEVWFTKQISQQNQEQLINLSNIMVLKKSADQPVVFDVYVKGQKFGKRLASSKGGQDVIIGESHDQTAQWGAIVGIVDGLKKAVDQRQIIIVNENIVGSCEDYATNGIEEWNVQSPSEHEGGLGDYYYHSHCSSSLNDFYDYNKKLAMLKKIDNTCIPRPFALNAISKLAPDVKYFEIDVNHYYQDLPAVSRDAAMALMWQAIRKEYPDAIIIGVFGANHAIEAKLDNPEIVDNRRFGTDYNDPLAEQLVYARAGNGEQFPAEQVHTIRILKHGHHLYNDAYLRPVYQNNGAFDEVWYITPQTQGTNSSWKPSDYPWTNVI